jgi:dCMP deaminase
MACQILPKEFHERCPVSDSRPSWDTYYLGIAQAVAVRADCTRRKVGALVVQGDRIVSTGYNGAPSGDPGCLTAGACPRGQASKEAVLPGSSYDTGAGACIALHAEQNAILRAGLECRGSTLYLTDAPCDGCRRLIKGSGIRRVLWPNGEWFANVRTASGQDDRR